MHSAAHLVYYFVIEILGKVKINGSEIQPEKARMDFGYENSIVEKIPQIEAAVNKFILEGHEIVMKNDPQKTDLLVDVQGLEDALRRNTCKEHTRDRTTKTSEKK